MVSARPDSVTNIHKRWAITRLNPSSYKISISITLASATAIISLSLYGSTGDVRNFAVLLFYGTSAIFALSILDYLALYGARSNKISKIFHVAAFGSLLWSVVLAAGIAIDSFLGYIVNSNVYLLEGMLIVTGFRIAIFTSVFGVRLVRAVGASFIVPVLFTVILLSPWEAYGVILRQPAGLVIGSFFVIWAVIWSVLADKAGRPYVPSTFYLLQAFLSAWTEQRGEKMENILEAKANNSQVISHVLKFMSNDANKDISIVIPGVHPGPFKPVGGSNLSYELYKIFAGKALVVHSTSDHSFNIPSRNELTRYLLSFAKPSISDTGSTCTKPIQIKRGEFIVTAIAFGKVCLVILSSPRGMEDIPAKVASNIQDYARQLGFSKTLVVDSHNAMGHKLVPEDQFDLILCAREAIDAIKASRQLRFEVGYAACYRCRRKEEDDVGQGGLAVLAFEVMKTKYAIGWADSNNLENKVRDAVLSDLRSEGLNMVEICTSDTHSTSGKRTRHGYYALGSITSANEIAEQFKHLVSKSFANLQECSFSLFSVGSNIKVMGKEQFDDYSKALDRSMNLTKVFLVTAAVVASMMLIVT